MSILSEDNGLGGLGIAAIIGTFFLFGIRIFNILKNCEFYYESIFSNVIPVILNPLWLIGLTILFVPLIISSEKGMAIIRYLQKKGADDKESLYTKEE